MISIRKILFRLDLDSNRTMRNKVFGVIGILWGGGITVRLLLGKVQTGNGAYGAGLIIGQMMGVMMLIAGLYAVFKPSDDVAPKKKKTKRKIVDKE